MKRAFLIVLFAVIAIMCVGMPILTMANTAMAASSSAADLSSGINEGVDQAETKATDVGNQMVGTLRRIGGIVFVVFLCIVGYKLIFGHSHSIADVKTQLIGALVGLFLIFGGDKVTGWIINLFGFTY